MRVRALMVLTAFLAMPLTSCFSEHSAGVTDVSGVCSVALNQLSNAGAFVPIRNFAFVIDTLRVPAGTRVTWVNCDATGAEPHTSTSNSSVWSSPLIHPGETYTRIFDTKGTFAYHCTPHPFMHGVVVVQ